MSSHPLHSRARSGATGLLLALALLAGAVATATPAVAQSTTYVDDPGCPVPYFNTNWTGTDYLQESRGPAQFPDIRPLQMLFLPVDFPNFEADGSAADQVGQIPFQLAEGLETISEGDILVTTTVADRVYRLPQGLGDPYYIDASPLLDDVLAAADAEYDFSQYDVVHVVPPIREHELTTASSYADINHGLLAPVDGRPSIRAVRYAPGGYNLATAVHETLHLFGTPDLYAPPDGDTARFVGGWSIMRGAEYDFLPGASLMNIGWDQLRIGWLDLDQRTCLKEAGTVDVTLTPLADGGGTRLIHVPVDDSVTTLLELRIPGPVDSQICNGRGGVLAYVADNRIGSGEGIYQVIDATPGSIPPIDPDSGEDRGACFTDVDDATMTVDTGPIDLGHGITAEVLSLDDASAVVRVTRSDTFASGLTTADQTRFINRIPLDADRGVTPRTGEFGEGVNQAYDVSQLRFRTDDADHVVLTRDDAFADALAGTSLLGHGPMLLLAGTDTLLEFVEEELDRVLPEGGRIYLLGGTVAVDQSVEDHLRSRGYDVRRLAGDSRIETSAAIATEAAALNPESAGTVLVARAFGEGTAAWADAVTAGGYAARTGAPLVLTDTRTLSDGLSGVLDAADAAVVLGGTAAISDDVASQLVDRGLDVRRVSGSSRDATAASIATDLWGVPAGVGPFIIVDGFQELGWATGLPAAGLSADLGAPLLVSQVDRIPDATRAMVTTCEAGTLQTLVHGLVEQVDDTTLGAIEALDGSC